MIPLKLTWGLSGAIWLAIVVMCCFMWGWPAIMIAVVFGLFPYYPLIGGITEGGRLKPERVRLYNTLHVTTLPIALLILGVIVFMITGGFEGGFWVLALGGAAWFVHIALDRVMGYGLRDADGSRLADGAPLR